VSAKQKRIDLEWAVLNVVQKEFRRAMRMKAPLHITIDPWLNGEVGATVFAAPDERGRTYEIRGGQERRTR
jgi:hypothetical protein